MYIFIYLMAAANAADCWSGVGGGSVDAATGHALRRGGLGRGVGGVGWCGCGQCGWGQAGRGRGQLRRCGAVFAGGWGGVGALKSFLIF